MQFFTIQAKFSVGEIVFQHDKSVDAVFRGEILGIQISSANAKFNHGDWLVRYEVKFGSESSDWVNEDDLMSDPAHYNWPARVADPVGLLPDVPLLADSTAAA